MASGGHGLGGAAYLCPSVGLHPAVAGGSTSTALKVVRAPLHSNIPYTMSGRAAGLVSRLTGSIIPRPFVRHQGTFPRLPHDNHLGGEGVGLRDGAGAQLGMCV